MLQFYSSPLRFKYIDPGQMDLFRMFKCGWSRRNHSLLRALWFYRSQVLGGLTARKEGSRVLPSIQQSGGLNSVSQGLSLFCLTLVSFRKCGGHLPTLIN